MLVAARADVIEPPVGAAQDVQMAEWPADRQRRGVSIIHAPSLSPDCQPTAVHFSWHNNSCAVRNYLVGARDNDPNRPLYRATREVLPLIIRERRIALTSRPAVLDYEAWQEIIKQINVDWRL